MTKRLTPAMEALVGLASAVANGGSDEDGHLELPSDAAAAPAGAGAAAPQPQHWALGTGTKVVILATQGQEVGGLWLLPHLPCPLVEGGAGADPDWFNASEDTTEGRLCAKPKHPITSLRLARLHAKDLKPIAHHDNLTEQEPWLWQGLTMVMGICRLPSVELY